MNMKVNIAGVEWKNPVTVASGTFGSGAEFADYVDLNKLGAVTTKGVAHVPWSGNATPRVAETYGGMMNAIGLQNPGIDLFCERDIPYLQQYDTKIIVNVCGNIGKLLGFLILPDKGLDYTDTVEIFLGYIVEPVKGFEGPFKNALDQIDQDKQTAAQNRQGDTIHQTQLGTDGECVGCRQNQHHGAADRHADHHLKTHL